MAMIMKWYVTQCILALFGALILSIYHQQAPEQAKFGGNLCCIQLNNADNYLIHSSLGDDGNPRSTSPVSLCELFFHLKKN